MPRFFVKPEAVCGDQIQITGSDVNHIKNVLRMNVGEEISVSDGAGQDYFGKIEQIDSSAVLVHVENSWDSYVELPTKLYLFQGLPKSDKMELIIQKAVELGVYAVVPVKMKRTIVKWDEKKGEKKLARWQQIAESAAKQSGRGLIPEVMAPMTFAEAIEMAKGLDAALLPYEKASGMDAARDLIASMRGKSSIGIFIGPEGGFDTQEVDEAIDAGVQTMTLGHRILRTETAGLTALSILMFELDQ